MHKPYLSFVSTLVVVGAAAVVLSGCTHTQAPVETPASGDAGVPAAAQKTGTTTKSGMLSQAGEKFFLTEQGQEAKEVNSYAVDLAEYVGQTVTVTGQYSGDTLYIGSIQVGEQ